MRPDQSPAEWPAVGRLAADQLPKEWKAVGRFAANLWQHTPWDRDVLAALRMLAQQRRFHLSADLAAEALASWSADGDDHATFAPTPGNILQRAREIEMAQRPELPPPPGPDPTAEVMETWERWAADQPATRQAEARAFMERLRAARSSHDRAEVVRDLVAWRRPPHAAPGRHRPGRPAPSPSPR